MRDQIRLHGPAVKVEAGKAGGRLMKARIDIIRPGLHAAHTDAAPGKGTQQADGDAGLAGAGARSADDERTGHGVFPVDGTRRSRMVTISPMTMRAGAAKP